jgi:hypothetical protein
MRFRDVKETLVNHLGAEAAGRYRTIGYQDGETAAEEVLNNGRAVQVYYREGSFPKAGGSLSGPVVHDITFRLEMTVARAAEGDLTTLDDPSASDAARAVALATYQESCAMADESLDELADIIYQVVMDARFIDLGQTGSPVANRWIDRFEKANPITRAEFVILTGYFELTCRVDEAVTGDAGTEADDRPVDVTLEVRNEDGSLDNGKAGAKPIPE